MTAGMPTEHVGFVLCGPCAGTRAAVNSQVNAMATSCPDDRLSMGFLFFVFWSFFAGWGWGSLVAVVLFLRHCLSLALVLSSRLDWLASEPPKPQIHPSLPRQYWSYRHEISPPPIVLSMDVLEKKLGSS